MKYLVCLFLLLLIFRTASPAQKYPDLRAELTPELVKEFDTYIRAKAPGDSAYYVMLAWANKHFSLQRAAVSAYIFTLYADLFPDKKILIDTNIKIFQKIMLSQTATHDMMTVYSKYIRSNAPSDDAFFALQRIADFYIRKHEWDSASLVYSTFKPLFPNNEKKINKITELINKPLEGLKIENLGDLINTSGGEWDPALTSDGRFLYFSADYRKSAFGGADIWAAENKDGIWQKAQNLGSSINGHLDETIDNVSADGTTLLISGNLGGSFGKYDIYTADKDSAGWTNITHLPQPVNSEYHDESGCITPDGKAILFSSDRKGGIGPYVPVYTEFYGGTTMGNMDLYVSIFKDSAWSEAINLGTVINTPYSERAVFLHPDGKTLYFSSNGHYGLGRLDVFKSVRLSDTSWTEWSEPVNLGKEINTSQDDWGYIIDLQGKYAYFAKENDVNSFGGWDIYSITLPEAAKPQPVAVIKGRVIDSLGRGIAANIIWEDLSTGKEAGFLKSDPRDGFYIITLPLGRNYGYYASRHGYYPSSNNIDLRNKSASAEIYQDILMVSVRDMENRGSSIKINNIFFDYDKYELKPESLPELNRLYNFLTKASKYNIIIEGHTDNAGSESYNNELSLKRAYSVRDYLINKGIPSSRITAVGYGFLKPVVEGGTEEADAKNRRVEIKLRR